MMIAVFGDIHSNLSALHTVFDYCDKIGVSEYYCVGDIVGYYANPNECIDLLIERNVSSVKGNHDAYIFENDALVKVKSSAAAVIEYTRNTLKPRNLDFLKTLPYIKKIESSIPFSIVHGSLNQPFMWNYVKNLNDALNVLTIQDTPICFYGHTHIPMGFASNSALTAGRFNKLKIDEGVKYLINVGSVGQPRQNEIVAHVVIFDIKNAEIRLQRLEYDPQKTLDSHKKADLPRELLDFFSH